MTQRLRIAAIGGRGMPSHYSGVERIWEELLPRLARLGHDVTAYCRPGVTNATHHKGVRLVTTPAPGGASAETLSHTWTSVRHAARGGGGGGGGGFDVIALHALPPQMFVRAARRSGATVVSHVHGLDWQRAKWRNTPLGLGSRVIRLAERRMVRHAHAVAVCAPYLADYYRTTYGLEAAVLPNGITPDDTPFKPDAATLDALGLRGRRFIVSIGRLVEEKRVHDSVAAVARLDDPGVRLVVVGEGPETPWLTTLRRDAGPRVVFAGHRSGASLETLFRCASAYVTASELEGLPSSVLEAMERRSCVVASDIPPHRLLLAGAGTSDLLFATGDVAGLAARLERLLASDAARGAAADAQRCHVRVCYAWDALAERTSDFYRSAVLANPRRPRATVAAHAGH